MKRRLAAMVAALGLSAGVITLPATSSSADPTWQWSPVRPNGNCHIIGFDGLPARDLLGPAFNCRSVSGYCNPRRTHRWPQLGRTWVGYYTIKKLTNGQEWVVHYWPLDAPNMGPNDSPGCGDMP